MAGRDEQVDQVAQRSAHGGHLAAGDALDRDEQLAAVQTIIRRPDGRIDGAGIDISNGTFRQIGFNQTVGEPLAVAWGVSATATLYRVAALGERIFDERLFAYYEDVELCARLKKNGWRTAVLPVIEATHQKLADELGSVCPVRDAGSGGR